MAASVDHADTLISGAPDTKPAPKTVRPKTVRARVPPKADGIAGLQHSPLAVRPTV